MIVSIPRLSTVHQADVFDGLAEIAERTGLRAELDGLREYRPRSRCESSVRGAVHYRLLGRHGRRLYAACWHAHRDVMRELFDTWPRATLISALATYRGAEDFDVSYRGTQQAYCDVDGWDQPLHRCVCIESAGYGWADSATWTPDLLEQ